MTTTDFHTVTTDAAPVRRVLGIAVPSTAPPQRATSSRKYLHRRLSQPARALFIIRAFVVSAALVVGGPVATTGAWAEELHPTPRCGDVVTADVTLTQDLRGCPGDGLIIGAPGVRVNLNHHRILGRDAVDTVGIRDDGFGHLDLFGGTVAHFDIGVDFENADHLHVGQSQLRDNATFGVLLVQTNGGSVVGTNVSRAGAGGIQLVIANRYLIARNHLTQNGDGVALFESSYNFIADNVSSDSGAGIDLVHASNHNAIVRNTTNNEEDTGVLLDDHADHNLIAGNHAERNDFAGIAVGASEGNSLRGNHTNNNPGGGIAIVDNAIDTAVIRNVANGNGKSPFSECVPECSLLDDGIHVDAPGTTLAANLANGNADLGIDAVTGVIDGRRNAARRNGDARECTGVICSN